jgi:hypothetical protein
MPTSAARSASSTAVEPTRALMSARAGTEVSLLCLGLQGMVVPMARAALATYGWVQTERGWPEVIEQIAAAR